MEFPGRMRHHKTRLEQLRNHNQESHTVSLRVKFGLLIVLIFGLVTVAMSLLQVH